MKQKYLIFIVLPMFFLCSNCSTPTKNELIEEIATVKNEPFVEPIINIYGMGQYQEVVEKSTKPVIVKFYAEWCPPCKLMTPIFHKVAEEYKSKNTVIFVSVNIDQARDVASTNGVKNIPTFLFFKNGKLVHRKIGSLTEDDLNTLIKQILLS